MLYIQNTCTLHRHSSSYTQASPYLRCVCLNTANTALSTPPHHRASPPPRECQLFIKGLPRKAPEQALRALVHPYESVVTRIHIAAQDHADGSRYGFVAFTTQEEAARALQELNGQEVQVGFCLFSFK